MEMPLDDDAVLDLLREQEIDARQRWFAMLETIQEVSDRGLAAKYGATSMTTFLREVLTISPTEAAARVKASKALLGERQLTGQLALPVAPTTAEAAAEGAVGAEQVRVIITTVPKLPVGTQADAEAFLATQARIHDAATLGKIAQRLKATLDPDGRAPTEEPEKVRELTFSTTPDGKVRFRGVLDPEGAAIVKAVLDPLAKPHPVDGKRDQRTPARRNCDAFVEAMRRLLTAADLPTCGGERPQLLVTITWDNLRDGKGAARLADGSSVTAGDARRTACEANIIPVVLGGDSEPLDVGRGKRLATPAIRKAITVRDRGCAFPGCDRPPTWCQSHHCDEWLRDDGETKPDNMTLLCGQHHRTVHRENWQIRIRNGRAEFTPPTWLDPAQTPRHNTLHHPPELPNTT